MSTIQIASLALTTIGSILCICCVFLPYWKLNDPEDTIRDSIFRHEGLWLKCTSYTTGNWDCDDFNRFFLGLPSTLQIVRGLSIVAVIFSVFSIAAILVGMDSTPCGGDDEKQQSRVRIIGGGLGIIAGLLVVAAVSWYANDVRIVHVTETQRQLLDPTLSVNRFIFGTCLFIGWAGGFLLILGGLLILCTSCSSTSSYNASHPGYAYRPPNKTPNVGQEYI